MSTADMFKLWIIKEIGIPILITVLIVLGIVVYAAIMTAVDTVRDWMKKRKGARI